MLISFYSQMLEFQKPKNFLFFMLGIFLKSFFENSYVEGKCFTLTYEAIQL
jgi:hypothetical protein